MMKYSIFFLMSIVITFNSIAQYTYVPDDHFEQTLIDQGLDDILDDYVLTANISGQSALHVANKYIDDLTGIEGFTSISQLHCQYNNLSTLDLSANTNLMYVYAFHNDLSSIDVSNCLILRYLDISHNQLSNLDLTNNTDLLELYCYDNLFSSLNVSFNVDLQYFECWDNTFTGIDVTNNVDLIEFYCNTNQITSLDLSNNTALERLLCHDNPLTQLDLTTNTNLEALHCYDTQITDIELTNNTQLTYLTCGFNDALIDLDLRNGFNTSITYYNSNSTPNLVCIFVDDADYSAANWFNKDPASTFVETQTECDNLTVNEFTAIDFQIFPNPVQESFSIQTNTAIEKLDIFNILGEKIKSYTSCCNFDIEGFKPGTYIIQIHVNHHIISKKLIIN